jgi:peptidoglycan/LPS O-acetylase OafA/YrhL
LLGALCWLVASAGCHIVRTQSPDSVALVIGYALVLIGTMFVFNGVAGWNAKPIPSWLLYLGKVSYGLYVFHFTCLLLTQQAMPFILTYFPFIPKSPYFVVLIGSVLALLFTIACASLTYKFLERPFLKLKDRFSVVRSRSA